MLLHHCSRVMTRLCTSIIFGTLLVACGSDNSVDAPEVSNDTDIQGAYENCLAETHEELLADNPDAPEDILTFMKQAALETCRSAVVTTCASGKENQNCQFILQLYQ